MHEFWKNVCYWWNTIGSEDMDFPMYPNEKCIIFGLKNSTESMTVLNLCILHIKYYIYRQRLFHDNIFQLQEIRHMLSAKLEIEKKICQKEEQNYKFENFRNLYENLIV